MVLMPTLANIAAAAILGFIVGVLKLLVPQRTLFAVPMPVVAATLVSFAVFYAASYGLPVDPLHMLVPPLVTFLPGGMLTLGMVELAYGDMVSGSSRLITGFVQLVLLTFGLAAGAALLGAHPENLVYSSSQFVKVPWAAWAGVPVFCLGVFLHFSAPRNSLPWILRGGAGGHRGTARGCGAVRRRDQRLLRHDRRHAGELPDSPALQRSALDGDVAAELLARRARVRSGCCR